MANVKDSTIVKLADGNVYDLKGYYYYKCRYIFNDKYRIKDIFKFYTITSILKPYICVISHICKLQLQNYVTELQLQQL